MKPVPARQYDDIITLPRHESPRRAKMSLLGRAAQFAPFAALSGYEGEVQETARLTDRCVELDEESLAILNQQLTLLMSAITEQPEVTLTYFEPDEKKSGGAYHSVTGKVRRIDEAGQTIILTDGRNIPLGKVHSIERLYQAGVRNDYCG